MNNMSNTKFQKSTLHKSCFECECTTILFDPHRDEHFCKQCKIVLQQNYTNYTPTHDLDGEIDLNYPSS